MVKNILDLTADRMLANQLDLNQNNNNKNL